MKTFIPKFRLFTCFATCAVAITLLATPLSLSAQHPGDLPDENAMNDSMQQRLQRKMAAIGLRMDSLSDYLANLHPGDEAFTFIAPDLSMIPDGEFFDDMKVRIADFDELSDQLENMPPMPEFDFQGDFFDGKNHILPRMHFFRGNPGHKGVWVYIEKPDSLEGKSCKKIKKVMVLRGGNDTIMLEGDDKMVYTIVDDNGQISVESNWLDGDTIISDSTRKYHVYGFASKKNNEPFRYNIRRRAGTREDERPFGRDRFVFDPGNSGSARLSDLTADEINRLRRTDLKPGKKVVPLGIDDLGANLLRRKQQLTLRFNAPGEGELQIQLFDDQGALIHDESLRKFNGRYDNRIALPESHNDILFLRITRGSQSLVKKLEL